MGPAQDYLDQLSRENPTIIVQRAPDPLAAYGGWLLWVVIVVMLLVSPVGLGGLLYLLDIVRPFKKAVLTVAIGASSLVFLITAACVAWMLTEGCRAAP